MLSFKRNGAPFLRNMQAVDLIEVIIYEISQIFE